MPLDKEKARKNIKDILNRMEKNTDASLLHEYYKLFKKEVPFFKRSFASAWLFMNYDEKETPRFRAAEKKQEARDKPQEKQAPTASRPTEAERKKPTADKPGSISASDSPLSEKTVIEKTIITIPEEESKHLFVSIGKNRRLFPKEIITLLLTQTSCAREDIGSIRILDNYSFVQVRDSKADEIIEKITGHKFRGRTLTVNYAKAKVDDGGAE